MRSHTHRRALCAAALCSLATAVHAEEPTTLREVTVKATRVEKSALKVPAAVSAVQQEEIQSPRQGLGLDESMGVVPGVFFQNRYNYAQDLRISIRGFGARSNFGIRGIRIYQDGVPLTLPDGQSNVDEIDLGSLGRIEVTRGSASSLYGSSSGGVINLYTEDGPATPFVSAQATGGSYNQQNYQLKSGGQLGDLNYLVNLNRLTLDGFRDQAELESNVLNSKFRYDFDASSSLTLNINVVNQPVSNDAGALTEAELAAGINQSACRNAGFQTQDGRRAANCRNVAFDAGESVDQQRFSLLFRKRFGEHHEVILRNYYLWRGFDSRLPAGGPGLLGNAPSLNGRSNSAWVEFDRFFMGGGAQYIWSDALFGHRNRFTVGVDVDSQRDDRQRYDNDLGLRGNLTFDQIERVNSRGVYAQNEFAITDTVELTASGRYDHIRYEVQDAFLSDVTGDDSDEATFHRANPSVGLAWSPLQAFTLYGNFSTSFETPTTTEFANPVNAGTAGGFNPNLRPQTSESFEIGIKGLLAGAGLGYDLTVFHIDTENEFVNVAVTGAPLGRTFVENADSTSRSGLEAAVAWQPAFLPGFTINAAYTLSDFTFRDFTGGIGTTSGQVFDGRALPGVPKHQFFSQVAWIGESGMTVSWDWLHVGDFAVNNDNSVQNPSYNVANLRASRPFDVGALVITPFVGVNNMFGSEYNGNARINAVGGRFFEPAPERNAYGGVTARFEY
jgi:iron complex outermembrane recepter protein